MKRYIKSDNSYNAEVSIADVDTKDILVNISTGVVRVENYQFKRDAAYQNGFYNYIYNRKLIPVGNRKGMQYGVVGTRHSSRYSGGYVGYKIEDGYLWCNEWYEETQAEAIQQVRISVRTPDESWNIYGKLV